MSNTALDEPHINQSNCEFVSPQWPTFGSHKHIRTISALSAHCTTRNRKYAPGISWFAKFVAIKFWVPVCLKYGENLRYLHLDRIQKIISMDLKIFTSYRDIHLIWRYSPYIDVPCKVSWKSDVDSIVESGDYLPTLELNPPSPCKVGFSWNFARRIFH